MQFNLSVASRVAT